MSNPYRKFDPNGVISNGLKMHRESNFRAIYEHYVNCFFPNYYIEDEGVFMKKYLLDPGFVSDEALLTMGFDRSVDSQYMINRIVRMSQEIARLIGYAKTLFYSREFMRDYDPKEKTDKWAKLNETMSQNLYSDINFLRRSSENINGEEIYPLMR